ncbi:ABC transporter ATP-binding protein [Nocardioides gilvus]|uniref:ABC transporter ATP-binding protein n=1 Tax=Nocardioides gilvus TaxID=1735589 RepID=UPI000D74E636|nr:ATP-binding cassette domain-containing protein [Nocardioides gilvus]
MSMLEVAHLTRRVGEKVLLADAGFTAPLGGVIALVGPNGAGKSSLLRLMSGTMAGPKGATAGRVVLDGVDLLSLKRRERARQLALVEQELRAEFSLTVRQVVALGRIPHESGWAVAGADDGSVDVAMRRAGVLHQSDRLLSTLSGGEQQRVQLARALAQDPRLLLLDEPTNHLDVRAQMDTLGLLREIAADGVTVVAALHDLNLAAAYCDHVVVLDRGRVRSVGGVRETLTPEMIEETYGVSADVLTHPRTGRPLIAFSPALPAPASAATLPDVIVSGRGGVRG